MEGLPQALLAEIIKRITRTNDLNSICLVSRLLYTVEAEQRDSIRVGCGLCPATLAISSLCLRFPNLCKVEINYSGWVADNGIQLDNQGLYVLSAHCPSLTDLTLSFCSYIDDSGLGCLACCKKLTSLRLNSVPAISSNGLLTVAVGCKSLSALHLIGFMNLGSVEWLEYLGREGSLEELVVVDCKGICQYDLFKFGPGWMKLQKFKFEIKHPYVMEQPQDPSYMAHYQFRYDCYCESLTVLTLARIVTVPEIGLRFFLSKCKELEKLSLHYVIGIYDSDIITLSHSCSNLTSISLRLEPLFNGGLEGRNFSTPLTDDSLKALALRCPMLQTVELTFAACKPSYPSEIGFTQEGVVMLIQSCPIRDLVLSGANFFNDDGMKALSSAQYLETLELMDCVAITDAGMRLLAHAPRLINLTLRQCCRFTDRGVTEVARARNLESLVIEGCRRVPLKAVEGAAKSVQYKVGYPGLYGLNRGC
uniref:F-box domain-containing protein n=1 Tax=Arundo donax TaxID=35708 RepID=A0A0A9BRN8_ARUDO